MTGALASLAIAGRRLPAMYGGREAIEAGPVINLENAKVLGPLIPSGLRVLADRVIE